MTATPAAARSLPAFLKSLLQALRPASVGGQVRAWREGSRYLLAGAALAALGVRRHPALAAPGLALATGVLFFLRDPARPRPARTDLLVAPADGRVIAVRQVDDPYWRRRMWEITVFLSILDVHVQYAPCTGRVVGEEWTEGKRRPAMWPSASEQNARHHIYLEGAVPVTVTQVAGLLARAIVSWVRPGQELAAGDRLGLIKLGSQTLLRWPVEAGEPQVQVGDHVVGSVTPVARLHP